MSGQNPKKRIEREQGQLQRILLVFLGLLVYFGFSFFVQLFHVISKNDQPSYPDPRVNAYLWMRSSMYGLLILTILGLVFFFLKRWHRPGIYRRSVRILGWVLIGGYFLNLTSSIWTCFWGKIWLDNLIYFLRFYGYGHMPMLLLGLMLLALARSIQDWHEMAEEHDLTV